MSKQQFQDFVAGLVPSWRLSQRKVLALCIRALVLSQCCSLSALARALPPTTQLRYRLKRLARFVDNPRLDLLAAWKSLAYQAATLQPHGWLPVLVDETGLRDRASLLWAAVPYRGRSLPLGCLAFSPRLIKHSLWKLREGFLWCLYQGLGRHQARMVVVADRGFAASHFFRWLHRVNLQFVVRVPAKVYVQWPGFKALLSQLELKPGSRQWLPGLRYGPKQAPLNLLVVWRRGCPQPWLIATSLQDPAEVFRLYRLRMRIEAFFKDAKSYFRLEACQLRTGARICTLFLALSMAFWWLAFHLPLPPNWEAQVRTRGPLSWLSLSLERLRTILLLLLFDSFPDLPLPTSQPPKTG